MSTAVFTKQEPSPVVTRRQPATHAESGGSQRSTNRRSLSGKLRSLFSKSSPSPNRTTVVDERPPRPRSPSPEPGPPADVPHLRAPLVNWSFGKKKTKPAGTTNVSSTTSKTKTKVSRKSKQKPPIPPPPLEISAPIYQEERQTSIRGQNFVPRTPDLTHGAGSNGRKQSSSSYETSATKGFRGYMIIDGTQQPPQAIVPDVEVFQPPPYTSDHSRSPSMNRQRLPDTSIEYNYYHDTSPSRQPLPMPDVEVIPTPQRKRKVGETPPSSPAIQTLVEQTPLREPTQYPHSIPSSYAVQTLVEQTPLLEPTQPPRPIPSSQLPTITNSSVPWKNTSSSTLNNSDMRSSTSSVMDIDQPKLVAPKVPFGSTSSKKKVKRTKSQSRGETSSTTIASLLQQNPIHPTQSWAGAHGSLPDAEIIHGGSVSSRKSSKTERNEYPTLTAIVAHHMRPPIRQDERPPVITTTTPTSNRRPPRFETSTTTLDNFPERQQEWFNTKPDCSVPSPSSSHRHDGHIRPITPPISTSQPDVSIIRVGIDDLRNKTPPLPPRPPRLNTPPPPIPPASYRSSTTVYTRDKHRFVEGGELRTWSIHDGIGTGYDDDSDFDGYRKPYVTVEIIRGSDQHADYQHNHQVVPRPTINDEYRYSPQAHEHHRYDHDQEMQEEEKYEVDYQFDRQQQQQQQQRQPQYFDETRRRTNDFDVNERYYDVTEKKDSNYSSLSAATRTSATNERDKIYDRMSRSYTDNERIQEPLLTAAPVRSSPPPPPPLSSSVPRHYTLKRTDSYDGLGLLISADAETRLNHYIRDVEPTSPGERAGLRKNDRIIAVNGINVENVDFNDVLILIKHGLRNDNLQFSVVSDMAAV